MPKIHLTAAEAAAALGVTRATLYAYTSRGQLRSEPVHGSPRERHYSREEIERLRERKEARRDPAKAARGGLHWGSPVLDSSLTLIHEGKLYYRGEDVENLARERSLEEIAGLLWDAGGDGASRMFSQPPVLSKARLARLHAMAGDDPISLLQLVLPLAGGADWASGDLRPESVRLTGSRLLRTLVAALTGRQAAMPVHRALGALWAPQNAAAAEAIRIALVLCADHELNASTFVARCAASAGASPYEVVSAALATLKGHRHGGASERLAALLAEIGRPERARIVIGSRLRRGEALPGFGHPLYANGDPRAALLLKTAGAGAGKRERRLVAQVAKAGWELLQLHPNLDFGLVAVARAFGLSDQSPMVLFALGRVVGWIAHAIEQYGSDQLIRPRARYTGPGPKGE
ncbi:MAG TPA: citrate synthase [Bryobacteraceae bacterium]|nr:citrate synthase [Bryobacteraceae bacterium]